MSQPVTLPGGTQVSRRNVIIGVGVVGGVFVVVLIYRHKRARASATPTVDTATGSTLPVDGSYNNPAPVRSVDNTVDLTGGSGEIVTNQQWVAFVIEQLSNWDPSFVQIALGAFLDDQELTSDQAALVRAAEGVAGPPPQGNHVIKLQQTASTPGTASQTPTPPPADTPPAPNRPTLRQGSRGPSVMDLQTRLNARGAHLAVDGIFGPLTDAAVRNFQRSVGITVDGIVGPITWSKLT